jgi:hypothetical protein
LNGTESHARKTPSSQGVNAIGAERNIHVEFAVAYVQHILDDATGDDYRRFILSVNLEITDRGNQMKPEFRHPYCPVHGRPVKIRQISLEIGATFVSSHRVVKPKN